MQLSRATYPLLAALPIATDAGAYTFETAVSDGCHERITFDAWRDVRGAIAGNLPVDPALKDDLPFRTTGEMNDEASIALLVGVRDVDLAGNDPVDLFEVVQTHGDPRRQHEHCLRSPEGDEPSGTADTLRLCRDWIRETTLAALRATGRSSTQVFLETRGKVDVSLPERYLLLGRALHTLEDSFAHAYRTEDGRRVRAALNWVDFVGSDFEERRDGPHHLKSLDRCDDFDPIVTVRVKAATDAARALLTAALSGDATDGERALRIDAVLDEYLSLEPGCTFDNAWCGAPERKFVEQDESGCSTRSGDSDKEAILGVALMLLVLRRRSRGRWKTLIAVALTLLAPTRALAQDTKTEDTKTAEPKAEEPKPEGAKKEAFPRIGAAAYLGASFDRPALATSLGLRVKLSERFTVGGDVEWNPWIALQTARLRGGVFNVYATGIYTWDVPLGRISLRTTAHLGTSTLLYDLYGAPSGSTGPYVRLSLIGVGVPLGPNWKLLVDPADVAMAMPHLAGAPLLHRQYRFTLGVQWGG